MTSDNRECPICGEAAPTFRLTDKRVALLKEGLGITEAESNFRETEGHWCLKCLTPYLIIWPEVSDKDIGLRLAGFPPKGGAL